jgi:alkylation response protein AidB-like acyl-CoA dehydrogenase
MTRLVVRSGMPADDLRSTVRRWIEDHVPLDWRRAAERGGAAAIRVVRSRADYEAWYPVYGASGLVVPTWPPEYGGLGLATEEARVLEAELAAYNLGRLNPLGLNLAAPALFAHGTEAQRLRYLPPIVRNEEVWCQLFSEPGAGSDLASLATRAERHAGGGTWVVTGQKVWSTWAHLADFGVLLARTDPGAQKRKGLTYFLIDLRQPGVAVRPLRHVTGEHDFNEVFLDRAEVPDAQRVGEVNQGWTVANATLSGERQMVSGSGSGGVDRIGGSGADRVAARAAERGAAGRPGGADDPVVRQALTAVLAEERVRGWTNRRVRAGLRAGRPPGPESSIGKVHQGGLDQRIQLLAADLLGAAATAWPAEGPASGGPEEGPASSGPEEGQASGGPEEGRAAGRAESNGPADYGASLPYEVQGMLRSRANTIEGGTTEVNKSIVAERVLGLPREPDPWRDAPWREVPRS